MIELLVIIALIGLLASIILISLKTANAKARDAKRVREINQFYKALEICYMQEGNYPSDSSFWDETGSGWKYCFSCGKCYGHFEDAIKECVKTKG